MKKILVVVDMQNDFIDGALGNNECKAVVPNVVDKINKFDGDEIYYTLDTHHENYIETQEGKKLPIEHCIEYSMGWMLNEEVDEALRKNGTSIIEIRKPTFGSVALANHLMFEFEENDEFEIEFCGLVYDICVISNIMLVKAFFPEAIIKIDKNCTMASSKEAFDATTTVLKSCQVEVYG